MSVLFTTEGHLLPINRSKPWEAEFDFCFHSTSRGLNKTIVKVYRDMHDVISVVQTVKVQMQYLTELCEKRLRYPTPAMFRQHSAINKHRMSLLLLRSRRMFLTLSCLDFVKNRRRSLWLEKKNLNFCESERTL